MTFKDLRKGVSAETTGLHLPFERLRNKSFWIWNIEDHKIEDSRTKGDCYFNHIRGYFHYSIMIHNNWYTKIKCSPASRLQAIHLADLPVNLSHLGDMSFRTGAHSELDSTAIDTEIEPQK